MEGCPDSDLNTLYLILSGFVFVVMFLAFRAFQLTSKSISKKKDVTQKKKLKDGEFRDLPAELYGVSVLLKDTGSLPETNHSTTTPRSVVVPDFREEDFA